MTKEILKSDLIDDIDDSESLEDYSNDDLFNITSWGADYSFRELVTMYEEDELLKPEMQRNYVWDQKEASKFIETILLGLPVPSIFLANTAESTKLIVDGYQRIMTVYDFLSGIFSKDNTVFKLSNNVNDRWKGQTFKKLSKEEQRKIRTTTIHAIIFEQKIPTPNDTSMYQIFERINTGGRTLTPQEIRNCVYHNDLNQLLFELNNLSSWRDLFGSVNKEPRMKDLEFILRAFTLSDYDYTNGTTVQLKKELNLYMSKKENLTSEKLVSLKKEFTTVIDYLKENLGLNAFHNIHKEHTEYTKKFHPTIFDSIYIATVLYYRNTKNLPGKIDKNNHLQLLKNEDYKNAISTRTTNIENILKRVNLASEYLYSVKAIEQKEI